MASIIRVKRSTGTGAPSSLNYGELGLTIGVGTHGNKGGRVFAGDNAQNAQVVGGRYYTDLLSIEPGKVASQANPTTAANGFVAILDQSRKVDQWNVDNLTLDGNTLSSSNTDGDITLDPNGSGEIVIPDDTFLTFGTSKDSKIEYDENGADKIQVTGADWNYNNGVQITISDVTDSTSKDTGALVVEGGVGIEKNLNVGGNLDVDGTATFSGTLNIDGEVEIQNIGISSNLISSKSGNQLYIDPFPDGLSNEGTVIIKGDLQVDGTTTQVNSSSVTVNDPILNLGDVTSQRTVMVTVASGISTITLDSVVGINTGDVLSVANINSSGIATVQSYNSTTKIVTFSGTTSGGISTETQVTVTHAYDTNTDRGVSFNYNTSTGTSNNEVGFFGYIDGDTNSNSAAPARSWTYVPDATITNSKVIGTRGFLDIKGIYFQTGDFNTNGVVWFDSDGKQNSTNNPTSASDTKTSTQVLTAVTEITLALPSNATIAAGAQITQQNNSSAYGVCKTSITNGNSLTVIGEQGTFDTTNDLVVNGTSISITPNTRTVVYTNKPSWTDTLDGGTF